MTLSTKLAEVNGEAPTLTTTPWDLYAAAALGGLAASSTQLMLPEIAASIAAQQADALLRERVLRGAFQ
jgi:hypothetical protein